MDRIKIIQIGAGGFGGQWVWALPNVPEVEVVGLVDINAGVLAEAGEKLGVPPERRFASLEDAMKRVDFEAAVVVIPPQARMPIYEMLMANGKDIICEKPFAATWDDAVKIRTMVEQAGVRMVVSQNMRHFREMKTLKEAVASGRWGAPRVSHMDFFAFPRFFGFREEMDHPLLIDMAIHHFDLIRYLFESNPIKVTGRSWNPMWTVYQGHAAANVVFEFGGGMVATYNGSWASLRAHGDWVFKWDVECEKGVVRLESGRVRAAEFRFDDQGRPVWGEWDDIPLVSEQIPQVEIVRSFIADLREGVPAPTRVADNIHTLSMVFSAVRACDEERTIAVPSNDLTSVPIRTARFIDTGRPPLPGRPPPRRS